MNFHRGYDQFIFVRGQEFDRYASPATTRDIDLDQYLAPDELGTHRETLMRQYLANIADKRAEEDHFAPRVFREAMKFVEQNHDSGKFLLVVDSFDPHEPWDPPKYYTDLYDPDYEGREHIWPYYGSSEKYSERELQHIRALYAGEVTMVDRWLGLFVDKLREVRVLDDTLIFLVTDHGHSLGEHGFIGKLGRAQYPELVDVPLLLRHPRGERAGRSSDAWSYDCDIFPTALHLLGIEEPVPVDGRDLWQLVDGGSNGREFATSGFGEYVRYQDEQNYLIATTDGRESYLYDLRHDPGLENDIGKDAPDVAKDLLGRIVDDAGGDLPEPSDTHLRRAGQWYETV